MEGKEIAWRTLAGERVSEPCIVGDWMFRPGFWQAVVGCDLAEDPVGVAVEAFRRVGANLVPQFANGTPLWTRGERPQAPRAEPEEIVAYVESLPPDEQVERDFDLEQHAAAHYEALRPVQEAAGGDLLRIGGFGMPSVMGGYSQWGYEGWLAFLILYPDHADRLWGHQAAWARLQNRAIAEAVRRYGLAPFVYSGDDICFNDGPMLSVGHLRRHYFPQLRWAIQPLHDAGIRIVWHCDGDVRPILPDLLAAGMWGFQGFQEETGCTLAHMAAQRTRWGTRPVLWGSVSVTTTLPFGTADQVRADVERCFRTAAADGPFALANSSSIMPEVPLENVLALYEHGRQFGREFLGGGSRSRPR